MSETAPQNSVASTFVSIEANIVIGGVEAISGVWVIYRESTGQNIVPDLADMWHWSFSFYAALGLLGVIIAGFALEAAAGAIERVLNRPLWGSESEIPRKWYSRWTMTPSYEEEAIARKWMWKSTQAFQEFTRRRLRILVARNTATFLLFLTVSWAYFVSCSLWLLLGVFGTAMFAWLWFDAQKGWNLTVQIAGRIGDP